MAEQKAKTELEEVSWKLSSHWKGPALSLAWRGRGGARSRHWLQVAVFAPSNQRLPRWHLFIPRPSMRSVFLINYDDDLHSSLLLKILPLVSMWFAS